MIDVGHHAPNFTLRDQHGQQISLGDYRDRCNLVVVFYPWAFSGVCSGELAEIRDAIDDLRTETSELVAISCDATFSLRVFADRDRLDFSLLSDFWPHGEVARSFGVFDEVRGCPERATFVIDRSGIVRWRVRNEIGQARDLSSYTRVLAGLA